MVATLRGSAARQLMHRQTHRDPRCCQSVSRHAPRCPFGQGFTGLADLRDLPAGVGVYPVELLEADPALRACSRVPGGIDAAEVVALAAVECVREARGPQVERGDEPVLLLVDKLADGRPGGQAVGGTAR